MRKFILTGMAVAMLAVPAAASASVTLDKKDDGSFAGTGFVGKGDVQYTFGWANKALQDNAKGVTFSYKATDNYEAVCTWTTGEGTRGEKTHNISHTTTTAVNSAVDNDPRQVKGQKQFTGFNLKGFGATTEEGIVPVVDAPCMGNEGHEGVWSSVTPTDSTPGALHVASPTNASTPLVSPPVVIPTV
jgi:hypothetical protein